jgi:hypothetical protein
MGRRTNNLVSNALGGLTMLVMFAAAIALVIAWGY